MGVTAILQNVLPYRRVIIGFGSAIGIVMIPAGIGMALLWESAGTQDSDLVGTLFFKRLTVSGDQHINANNT